jgi:hypothetical protein
MAAARRAADSSPILWRDAPSGFWRSNVHGSPFECG